MYLVRDRNEPEGFGVFLNIQCAMPQECSTLFNSVQHSAVLALNIFQEVRHAILPSDDERPIKIHYRAS